MALSCNDGQTNEGPLTRFSAQVAIQMGHYVYALIDPRKDDSDPRRIFYIGKGQGNRCFSHAEGQSNLTDSSKQEDPLELKLSQIREILATGLKPAVKIVVHGLVDQERALQIESILINPFGLTNKQSGHMSSVYWLEANQLEEKYGEPVYRSGLPSRLLLVSLNKSYASAKDNPQLLKERTLGEWTVGYERAKHVDFIVGVFRDLMVSFYKTEQDGNGCAVIEETNGRTREKGQHRRFRWSGVFLPEWHAKYHNRAIQCDESSKKLTTLPSGAAYRYLM